MVVSNATWGPTSSADSFAVVRGQSEGVPACALGQLHAHREPLHLAQWALPDPVCHARCWLVLRDDARLSMRLAPSESQLLSFIYLESNKPCLPL